MKIKKLKIEIGKKSIELSYKLLDRVYLLISVLALVGSTGYWSIYSAKLATLNSDQLAPPHFLGNLSNTTLSSENINIIKWPFYLIIRLFHFSHNSYLICTVGVTLLTVVLLSLILYRFEKRPLVIGTILLSLSSVLLMIPLQSSPGSLMVANMGTLYSRNIEYIIYISSIYLVFKVRKLTDIKFVSSLTLLAILIFSDRLFMSITLIGSIIGLVYLMSRRKWNDARATNYWFIAGLISTLLAFITMWTLSSYKVLNLISKNAYYSPIKNFGSMTKGLFFGASSLLTSFGSNPAYYTTKLKYLPINFAKGFMHLSGLNYVINLLIIGFAFYSVYKFIINRNLYKGKGPEYKALLSLVASCIALIIIYVFTDHNYAADSNYLTLIMFTGFISISYYLGNRKLKRKRTLQIGLLLLLNLIIALFSFKTDFNKQYVAYSGIILRDQQIISAYNDRKNSFLVGDYWRVYPIQYIEPQIKVIPYNTCGNDKNELNASQKLVHSNFSVILTIDNQMNNSNDCNNSQSNTYFGKPSSSALIDGSYSNPKEYLVYYDHLPKKKKTETVSQITNALKPIPISDFKASCSKSTVVNVVAHQDDDLLFINPEVYNDINSNKCVRTIYLTAGDSGKNSLYWISRQTGVEQAYNYMLGNNINYPWTSNIVKLADNEYIKVVSPKNRPDISLVFFNLPDGNLDGSGFKTNNYQSLKKLLSGIIAMIGSVDNQSSYSKDSIINAVELLINLFSPSVIRTQDNLGINNTSDHSDHIAAGKITTLAYNIYEQDKNQNPVKIPIYYYYGYQIQYYPSDVFGNLLDMKKNAFAYYISNDLNTCIDVGNCTSSAKYGKFISRNYTNDN